MSPRRESRKCNRSNSGCSNYSLRANAIWIKTAILCDSKIKKFKRSNLTLRNLSNNIYQGPKSLLEIEIWTQTVNVTNRTICPFAWLDQEQRSSRLENQINKELRYIAKRSWDYLAKTTCLKAWASAKWILAIDKRKCKRSLSSRTGASFGKWFMI